jgi:hypothetical protein
METRIKDEFDSITVKIADFVGERLPRRKTIHEQQWKFHFCDGYYPNLKNMRFDSSWDWLMPVVEQIQKIIHKNRWPYEVITGVAAIDGIMSLPIHAPKEEVYQNIVRFIKWYGEHANTKSMIICNT